MSIKRKQMDHINVERYFNRKFEFVRDDSWNLPCEIYQADKFIIPENQERKNSLNKVKEQLSKFDLMKWSRYTKWREPSTSIISNIKQMCNAELVTQAWCKFYECLFDYPLILKDAEELNSVHLCEAPGAFISAFNHYLHSSDSSLKWDWIGTTLNPYHEGNLEMIPDDRLIRFTLDNWYFGLDLTGDITKYYNHQGLVDFTKNKWKRQVQLVTADGSTDCMDNPGDQELIVGFLHYCETMTALQILEPGGSFVIKMFTMFEESTICLMYLLNCCFKKVHVFKPCTSKSGNSEVYVICLKYVPVTQDVMNALMTPYNVANCEKSMFSLDNISETFMSQISECASHFMEKQIKVINENVKYFNQKMSYKQSCWIKELRNTIGAFFKSKYNIPVLNNELRLVKNNNISKHLYYIAEHFVANDQESLLYNKLNINDMYPIDVPNILDIQIGKHIINITHSKYHIVTNYSYFQDQNKTSNRLYELTLLSLKSKYNIIAFDNFRQFYGVSKFHRLFFQEIYDKFKYNKDMLIVGVPLLTNFLVGLFFLISLAFKQIFFLNNIIVLVCPNSNFESIKHHLELVNKTYLLIDNSIDLFIRDILFVIPLKYIYNEKFIRYISKYNDAILRYKF